jgi:hypothetical protein
MSKMRKSLISCFIILNFLCMVRVFAPLETNFFSALYRPIDSYLSFFSIYQDWMMFAPNPGRMNIRLSAEVEFLDGTKEDYFFPNTEDLSLMDKYIYGEKYRKLISEGIRKDNNHFMWKDTAKFVLRKIKNDNFEKIPAKVHLIRHWDDIPDIAKKFRLHKNREINYESFRFYTYEVI